MSGNIVIQRDRSVPVEARELRRIAQTLLRDLLKLERFDLGINLVRAGEMTRINETFLQHQGSTDVITFDYAEPSTPGAPPATFLHGEIFICHDEAGLQACRFRTTWPDEIVRYLVHGVLHLRGHDDHHAAARRQMKREENRLLRELSRRFALSRLARPAKVRR